MTRTVSLLSAVAFLAAKDAGLLTREQVRHAVDRIATDELPEPEQEVLGVYVARSTDPWPEPRVLTAHDQDRLRQAELKRQRKADKLRRHGL